MLICQKCGAENTIGRVFCDGCGAKLDLSNLSHENVSQMSQVSWIRRYWPWGVGVIVALILFCVFLGLWPRSGVIGQPGTILGASRIEQSIDSIKQLEDGKLRSVEVSFSEKDINGYFRYRMSKPLGLLAVMTEVHDGYLRVRVIRRLWEWKLFGTVWQPFRSYDLLCVPYGGSLVVSKVSVGHLRVRGLIRNRVIRGFYRRLAARNEIKAFSRISSMKAESGRITATAER